MSTTIVKLFLKESIVTASGKPLKDTSELTVQQVQLLTPEKHEKLPNFTLGAALLTLINSKKNCKDLEEMAKMQRLLVSIRNKMITSKGEWQTTKDELLALESVFKTAPIAELNVNIHGQIYGKIQDLLRDSS